MEACEYLKCKPRTIERYTQRGDLPCAYEGSERGGIVMKIYERDLKEFKQKRLMQQPPNRNGTKPKQLTTGTALARRSAPSAENALLAKLIEVQSIQLAKLTEVLDRIATWEPVPAPPPPVEQLTYSLEEAVERTGFEIRFLRKAIREGRLRVVGSRKNPRVKPEDLEEFVKKE